MARQGQQLFYRLHVVWGFQTLDADRKNRGLPSFVPKPRGMHSLDPEDRSPGRQEENDDYGDYEVTGLMCESEDGDADCDIVEIESRENIFDVFRPRYACRRELPTFLCVRLRVRRL